jgi:secreted trypsin-like serine protease
MGRSVNSRRRAAGVALFCALLLIGAVAPGAGPASPGAGASIVGGKIAKIADFPSLAFISARDKEGGGFDCTGTVISPRVVLTAAHCVEDLEAGGLTPADEYTVTTGFVDPHQAKGADLIQVSSTHVFPEFDPGIVRADAGVLILATPTAAPPIPLATAADAALYLGGSEVLVAGWGLRRADSSAAPRRLRTASTLVQEPAYCKQKTRPYEPAYSPAKQMCTLELPARKVGDCFGDSGGPAIASRADGSAVEIGITSTGAPGCDTKLPNIFTRADLVSAWALEWAAATEAGAPSPNLNGPQARLPKLTQAGATRLAVGTLTHTFGPFFTDNRESRGSCKSLARARVKCEVAWVTGSRLFGGVVAIHLVLRGNAVVVKNDFEIREIDLACLATHKHRRACPAHVFRG